MTTKVRPDVFGKSGTFAERSSRPRRGIVAEMGQFVVSTKKWWLIPILAGLAVAGLLILLGSSAAAPFIYTVF